MQKVTSAFIILQYTFVADFARDVSDVCIVQYAFQFGEHNVKICSRGNSHRHSDSYIRTHPSTLQRIEEGASNCWFNFQSVVAIITETEGGIMKCQSPSNLPRNHQQVSNVWHECSSKTTNHDLIDAVMEMCVKAKSGCPSESSYRVSRLLQNHCLR